MGGWFMLALNPLQVYKVGLENLFVELLQVFRF